jgi:hypothetical protein
MSGEFKAKAIDASKFYQLKQFVFMKGNLVDALLLGSIAGLLFSSGGNTVLIAVLIGLYILTSIPLWKKRKRYVKLIEDANRMRISGEEINISGPDGEVLETLPIEKTQRIKIQIRASAWRERIWDYFRPDFKERAANYMKIGDRRIDFILESDYALQQLMDLVILWESKGMDIQIDIEKCFVEHLRRLPLRLQ